MNVVPPSEYKTSVSTVSATEFRSNAVPSLPDTLRGQVGARPLNTQLNDRHPLETRVKNWDANEQKRKLEQYRQIFGVAEPMRRVMELEIVQQTDFNPIADPSNIHRDILLNKEASIDWEDIYPDSAGLSGDITLSNDVHTKIEKSLGI
ncbi:Ump1p Ecym_7079 [Eremothecium cymbalariae DBVPG|uniref:Proteasome maturation factor UMP1 n=1 Tax=Eremothecium cymbalariae (strain CBS 270.75 / DBVPG 7215 / KCTC 17166 / NRRL Y-17582) TaxID=931890 RepID=G8JVR7_ERECY|nr:hypothetical protein Ecym_7079 [Eremothecium cymbalariae DBVPG\